MLTITGTANDHGSGPDDATPVKLGVPVAGTLRKGIEDVDWFEFQAQAGAYYELYLSLATEGNGSQYLFAGLRWPPLQRGSEVSPKN